MTLRSSHSDAPMARHRPRRAPWARRRRKSLFLFGAITFVLVIWGGRRLALKRQVDDALAEVEAQGYPMTLEALDAYYPHVPADENGALVYTRAFALHQYPSPEVFYKISSFFMAGGYAAESLDDAETLGQVDEYLDFNEPTVEALHEAAAYERYRYPFDLSLGYYTVFDHHYRAKTAAQLLCLRAFRAAIEMDTARVTESICGALAAQHVVGEESPLSLEEISASRFLRAPRLDTETGP